MDAVLPRHYDSPAVDLTDFGLHIGYLPEEGELQISARPQSSLAAAHRAQPNPAPAQAEEDQPMMRGGSCLIRRLSLCAPPHNPKRLVVHVCK
eukprot:scaffold265212_cov18-Tisochrysis_lutea.AAC.1